MIVGVIKTINTNTLRSPSHRGAGSQGDGVQSGGRGSKQAYEERKRRTIGLSGKG